MKKKHALIIAALSFSCGLAHAQGFREVTGTITSSDDGMPVVGATVQIIGTNSYVITDVNGRFTIKNTSRSDKKIRISCIGMKTVEVSPQEKMQITLTPSSASLDEVMVVAYGTAKKSSFTGSAAVVKAEEIGKVQSSNVANALTGKVAGVQLNNTSGQPGSTTPAIRIRGISSINAGNAPLVILDGAPYDGDLNNLNAQDIESMTVLKDAASNALYGARGANGVILITTKKGKMDQTSITFDAKFGMNTKGTREYDYIKDPKKYYEMYYGALKSKFISDGLTAEEAHVQANKLMTGSGDYGLGYNIFTVPEGEALIGVDGKLNAHASLGNLVSYKGQEYLIRPDNWLDETYGKGFRQEYNLSASGATEKSSFFLSANYLDNQGITVNSDYQRFTGRLKADYQLKPWLKLGANMSYTHFESNSLGNDGETGSSGNMFAAASRIAPIYPFYVRDAQGNVLTDENGITRYDYGDGTNAGLVRPPLGKSHAYSQAILDKNHSEGNAMTASGFADIKLYKDLKFTWNSGVTIDETRGTRVDNPFYGQYASSNGIVYKTHSRALSYNHQQLLNYKKLFGVHSLAVMLGHESYRSKYYSLNASKSNMFDPNNSELAGAITDKGGGSYTSDYNTEGYFGRIQYDVLDRYFFSTSYRRDASSKFHPDHRWGNFWSAGAAWLLSKEEFFNVKWVNELKLKASYGSQGNDNIGNYRYVTIYEIVNSSGRPAAVPVALGNENITWEKNGNFNVGVDFSLFKNRLSGSVEYFYRKTSDMLFSFPLPPSNGYTSYYANVGNMRNQGFEIELNAVVLQTRDFRWDVSLNMTHYKNKITELPEERKTMNVEGYGGYSSGNFYYGEGLSLYTYRMPKYVGVDQEGRSLYLKDVTDEQGRTRQVATTEYSQATQYLCGTALPDVYGGFGTKLSYKGFDLSADFIYQIGGQVYDGDYASMMSAPNSQSKGWNFHEDLLNAWTPDHMRTEIPRMQFGDNTETSDRFLTSASYIGFQNVNFGYTFSNRQVKFLGLEGLRLYFSADNICVWSKRKGLDPRQDMTGSATSSRYAPIRTISAGVTITL